MNQWRQKLHLEPQRGWLNDPNGLSWFDDFYHVYFQFCPTSSKGAGEKCWGHWKSQDLLHWQFTGTVLRPDIPEDKNGVYSGCGIVAEDTLHLFYTGNVKEQGDYDYITAGRGANVIAVTTKNGHHMSDKQVLLRNADYPEYCSCHVRDPKVWKEGDIYRMILGARTLDDKGCVLYYSSKDLEHWQFDRVDSIPDFGYMWECPDDFTIENHRYLSLSPQGLPHEEYAHQNVYSAGYFKADDGLKDFTEWDYGFDFYAPQTFDAPDGRKLLIGWMGIGDIPYTNPTEALGWQHCLTVPRELTVHENGTVLQNPIHELQALRQEQQALTPIMSISLPFELLADTTQDFTLYFNHDIKISYQNQIFILQFLNDTGSGRTVRKVKLDTCHHLHLLADTSSLEIYLNDGEKVLSTRYYPKDSNITLTTTGISGTVFTLNSMEVENYEE